MPRLLQEMSERFQRRLGNVMLNPLGVGFGNLGGDTQRDKKVHDEPVTGSHPFGQRLSSLCQETRRDRGDPSPIPLASTARSS